MKHPTSPGTRWPAPSTICIRSTRVFFFSPTWWEFFFVSGGGLESQSFFFLSLCQKRVIQFCENCFGMVSHTPLKFNIAPENRQSKKETHLPTIIFQGRAVKFRGCIAVTYRFFEGKSCMEFYRMGVLDVMNLMF